MRASPCQLIVCEKASHFAVALRQILGSQSRMVVETRSLAGCEAALVESPESLVAIEVNSANLDTALVAIWQIGKRYPLARVVALVATEMQAVEGLVAEAGAIGVFYSVLEAPRLANMAQKKMGLVKPMELSSQEFVAQRMPWAAQASA